MKRVGIAGASVATAILLAGGAAAWTACTIYDTSLLLPADGGGVEGSSADDGALADAGDDTPMDAPTEDGCAAGFARCGTGACDIQLEVDPKNCGACAHDCQSAACLAAVCQPSLVASGQNGPSYVAVDQGVAYWTNTNGTVMRANVDGSHVQQIGSGYDSPWIIKVSAGRVYFTSDSTGGALVAMNLDGGALRDLSGPQRSPRGLTVTATRAYFGTEDTDAGSIQGVDIDGSNLTVLATGTNGPRDVVTDGEFLYWAALEDQRIDKIPVDGGATSVVANATAPFGLAVFGSYLFYTNHADALTGGSVGRVGIDGTGQVILAPTENMPRSLVVDGTFAYWTNEGDGTVKRVPIVGGSVTTLATGQIQPWGITVDDTFVYWAAKGAGLVLRVAK